MRRPHIFGEAHAGPEQHGKHEGRDPGGEMHHEAAGEVEHASLGKPAAAPDPMGHRDIDEEEPEQAEQQHGAEAHALDEGADDERRA